MRFAMIASVALLAAVGATTMERAAAAESATAAISRICLSEDILMHGKKVKITAAYRQEICPCIVGKVGAKAKPDQLQALADALKLPVDQRGKAMMNGKNRALSMGSRAFLEAQMACGRDHPLKD